MLVLAMIITTEAIVLRARTQGDTSRIVTLYTREFGMVNVIAKGAREMRSPFTSSLQLFNYISAVLYKKENRDLHLLSKAEPLAKISGIQQSLEQLAAASKIAEIVLRSIRGEQQDVKLFELLVSTLQQIAESPAAKAPMLAIYFCYHFAALEGFALQLPAASVQGKYVLDINSGEIKNVGAASSHPSDYRFVLLSARAVDVLASFDEGGLTYLPSADAIVTDELESVLEKYLRAHIESLRVSR